MSILSRLGASMGIGNVNISVAALEPQQFRGGIAGGVILLQGGSTEQEVMKVTIDLTEFWVTGSGKNRTHHTRKHERIMPAENLRVAPGFSQEFPFQFSMPADARCTRRREGWTLNAEAHIAWAVDARAHAVLKVLPHPEVLAIQRSARDSFGLIPIDWDGSRREIYYNFGAPAWLQEHLDGVAFRLLVNDDSVTGEMILNRQERGAGDMLKALIGGDKQTVPIAIPRAALITQRGSPNPAGAYPHLQSLFESAGLVVPAMGSAQGL